MDPNYKYQQVIILLSDGLNTQDRWYTSTIDARSITRGSSTCDNIKAAGITIYTIQVNTGGDPTSTLLARTAPAIRTKVLPADVRPTRSSPTFNTIGTNLTKLRVAQ